MPTRTIRHFIARVVSTFVNQNYEAGKIRRKKESLDRAENLANPMAARFHARQIPLYFLHPPNTFHQACQSPSDSSISHRIRLRHPSPRNSPPISHRISISRGSLISRQVRPRVTPSYKLADYAPGWFSKTIILSYSKFRYNINAIKLIVLFVNQSIAIAFPCGIKRK